MIPRLCMCSVRQRRSKKKRRCANRAEGSAVTRTIYRTMFVAVLTLSPSIGAHAASDPASAIRTLYLIRHGAYDTRSATNSEAGPGLTPLGIAQSHLIAARLRGLSMHLDSLTSGTLTRARETAAVMHETLPDIALQQSPLLSECTPPRTVPAGGPENDQKQEADCQKQLDSAFAKFFAPPS